MKEKLIYFHLETLIKTGVYCLIHQYPCHFLVHFFLDHTLGTFGVLINARKSNIVFVHQLDLNTDNGESVKKYLLWEYFSTKPKET